jgi:hypothetical protein
VGCSIIALSGQNLNPNEEGECATEPIYNLPHCLGLEEGEVREGFGIPCGRGNGWTAPFYYIVLFVVFAGEFTFVPYECACCIKFFSPLDAVLKEFL